ncbi:sulfite exporter TauE/SafE family protein [Halocynthiibacter namhaensis]|uniref:sulfite exporter TauE/SafE family protein n=1 Tax=Halocynthiibacter namhaensis TaxID=1290553 RepID=UPI001EE16B6F|nr:sulfite exporter TauE/SafE family protein [Halocynthiibacter namhaensis]
MFAGVVKGAVGFAMPMIMISGISSILPAETALAMLILPTVMTNVTQALRQGWRAAWRSVKRFKVYLMVGGVFLVIGAQLVPYLPSHILLLIIGAPVTVFALMQLFGMSFTIAPASQLKAEAMIASVAGFIGGMSGVWGPPTVAYLTAVDTPKREHVRVQGAIYGLGAVALFLAHLQTGIVSTRTLPASALMLLPAGVGMLIGFAIHDRLDQAKFKKATLVVLVVAGLNLVRRGLMG